MNKGVKVRTVLLWFIFMSVVAVLMGKEYKSGELRTIESYRYGRFEVRMRSAGGSGVVSSFFTYHDYTSGGVENWNEIDIEILGRYTNFIQFNTITPGQVGHEFLRPVCIVPHNAFHVYAIEWTPGYVAWFVEGEEVYRQTGPHIGELNRYHKIMMNLWPPDFPDWSGPFDDAILPVYAYYDWVRYYAYTPGDGDAGTDSNFTQLWQDDFNFFDGTRWRKANHTFWGNNSDFIPENVVFHDSYMILCLTNNDSLGYNGATVEDEPDTTSPVFDDFENGYIFNWFTAPDEGSITLSPSPDVPSPSLGITSLYILCVAGASGGHTGEFGLQKAMCLESVDTHYLNLFLKPNPVYDFSLSVLLRDDDNGDGVWDESVDDEFRLDIPVNSGTDWQLMSWTYGEFYDNNPGEGEGNGVFDPTAVEEDGNGFLLSIAFDVYGIPANAYLDFLLDHILFSGENPLAIHSSGLPMIVTDTPTLNTYPNPANRGIVIEYEVRKPGMVTVEIIDLLGKKVRTLVHEPQGADGYCIGWSGVDEEGNNVGSGIYFVTVTTTEGIRTRKIVLMK
jgi:hypothetical protein